MGIKESSVGDELAVAARLRGARSSARFAARCLDPCDRSQRGFTLPAVNIPGVLSRIQDAPLAGKDAPEPRVSCNLPEVGAVLPSRQVGGLNHRYEAACAD